jgi:hypothetical protein
MGVFVFALPAIFTETAFLAGAVFGTTLLEWFSSRLALRQHSVLLSSRRSWIWPIVPVARLRSLHVPQR